MNEDLTKLRWQGEEPMGARGYRLTPKSDQVSLEIRHLYSREVAGKVHRWLRDISSSERQYLKGIRRPSADSFDDVRYTCYEEFPGAVNTPVIRRSQAVAIFSCIFVKRCL